MISFGAQTASGHAGDGRFENLTIVGELLRDGRGARAHDAEHVAFVNQQAHHSLDQIAGARRAAEIEMQVVDEEQEHAAGRVVGRPVPRQDDAFLHRRRRRSLHVVDASAVCEHERRDLLLDAVLVDFELVGLDVSDELVALLIANDDVGRDEIDADPERGLSLLPLRLGGGRLRMRDRRRRRHRRQQAEKPRGQKHSCSAHAIDYTSCELPSVPTTQGMG